MNKSKILSLFQKYRQFILYSFIGASGATLDFIVFAILYNSLHVNPLVATAISISVGITNNFVLNTLFNFKKRTNLLQRFVSFYSIGIIGLLLSIYIIHLFHDIFGIDANIAKLISIPVIVILQYVLNSRISFSDNGNFLIDTFKRIRRYVRTHPAEMSIYAVGLIFMLVTAPYFKFVDEADNFLGGKLILEGILPYTGFFSHHMPLPYFLSTILLTFSDNLVVFRILFAIVNFSLVVLNMYLIKKFISRNASLVYGLAAPLILITTWGNMLLAEVFVAHAVVAMTLLLIINRNVVITLKKTVFVSCLLALMVLSGLSYIYLAAIFGVVYAIYTVRQFGLTRPLFHHALILIAPYFIFALIIVLTGSLSAFIYQNYTFNTQYYSLFSTMGSSVFEVLITTPRDVLLSLYGAVFNEPHMLLAKNFVFIYPVAGAVVFFLLFKKRPLAALLLVIIGIYTLVRIRGFGDSVGVHYLLPWRLFALLCFIVAGRVFLLDETRYRQFGMKLAAYAISVGIITFSVVGFGTLLRDAYYIVNTYRVRAPQTANVMIYDNEPSDYVNKINAALDTLPPSQRYVWMAPLQFQDLYYIRHPYASKYTFYLPWHGKCDTCNDELLADFGKTHPSLIYWKAEDYIILPNFIPSQYGQRIDSYIQKEYTESGTVDDLYIRNDLVKKLSETLDK